MTSLVSLEDLANQLASDYKLSFTNASWFTREHPFFFYLTKKSSTLPFNGFSDSLLSDKSVSEKQTSPKRKRKIHYLQKGNARLQRALELVFVQTSHYDLFVWLYQKARNHHPYHLGILIYPSLLQKQNGKLTLLYHADTKAKSTLLAPQIYYWNNQHAFELTPLYHQIKKYMQP